MNDYTITVRLQSDMERDLVEALAESMVDDSMFGFHEVLEVKVDG